MGQEPEREILPDQPEEGLFQAKVSQLSMALFFKLFVCALVSVDVFWFFGLALYDLRWRLRSARCMFLRLLISGTCG